jgi:hypothetical protein
VFGLLIVVVGVIAALLVVRKKRRARKAPKGMGFLTDDLVSSDSVLTDVHNDMKLELRSGLDFTLAMDTATRMDVSDAADELL